MTMINFLNFDQYLLIYRNANRGARDKLLAKVPCVEMHGQRHNALIPEPALVPDEHADFGALSFRE